jgi:pimeloyl-ACP methyl ester carboxylesterase
MERVPAALIDTARLQTLRDMESSGALASDPVGYCNAYWRAYLVMYVGSPAFVDSVSLPCNLRNEWPQNFSVTYQRLFAELPEWDWRSQAAEVAAPTLTVHGEIDRVAPHAGGREWAAYLPDARFLSLPEVGHLVWAERPDETVSAIDLFLDGTWPANAVDLEPEPELHQ